MPGLFEHRARRFSVAKTFQVRPVGKVCLQLTDESAEAALVVADPRPAPMVRPARNPYFGLKNSVSRASAYEEGCDRGALQKVTARRDVPVNAKRRRSWPSASSFSRRNRVASYFAELYRSKPRAGAADANVTFRPAGPRTGLRTLALCRSQHPHPVNDTYRIARPVATISNIEQAEFGNASSVSQCAVSERNRNGSAVSKFAVWLPPRSGLPTMVSVRGAGEHDPAGDRRRR